MLDPIEVSCGEMTDFVPISQITEDVESVLDSSLSDDTFLRLRLDSDGGFSVGPGDRTLPETGHWNFQGYRDTDGLVIHGGPNTTAIRNLLLVRDINGAPIAWVSSAGGVGVSDNIKMVDNTLARMIAFLFRNNDYTKPALVFGADGIDGYGMMLRRDATLGLIVTTASADCWRWGQSGNYVPATDATFDLGAITARVNQGFFAGAVRSDAGFTIGAAPLVSASQTGATGKVNLAAGDISCTSTTWGPVTATALDVTLGNASTLPLTAGMWVEIGLMGFSGSATPGLFWDVATISAGAPVSFVSGLANASNVSAGVQGWRCGGATNSTISGTVLYQVQASDIVGGTVKFRPYFVLASAGSRSVLANANAPLGFHARILG